MKASAPLPLAHVRVIDQTQVMAGPTCTMLLGDMGADVIKVEPPDGETTRGMEPALAPGLSAAFLAVNRNKRSLAVDLKHPRGREAFLRLVATADVLVENYRPGVARRLGVEYDTLATINPGLVYCSISGFGQTGPYADRGGYDLIAQGMSGIMSVTGHEHGPPVKVGVPITDLGAGLFALFGILVALRARQRTGRGQYVDTSLFEAGLALSVWESTEYWCTGRVPKPLGTAHRLNAPYQAFRASDAFFTVGASNDRLWPRFCRLLGQEDLVADPRFATLAGRIEHRAALEELIEQVTRTRPRAHWLARCDEAGIPAGPINTVPEAHDDPQARARGMVQEIEHPDAGRVKTLGNPVKLSASPPRLCRPAPRLGEDTGAVLRELGYSDTDLDALAAENVIAARVGRPLAEPNGDDSAGIADDVTGQSLAEQPVGDSAAGTAAGMRRVPGVDAPASDGAAHTADDVCRGRVVDPPAGAGPGSSAAGRGPAPEQRPSDDAANTAAGVRRGPTSDRLTGDVPRRPPVDVVPEQQPSETGDGTRAMPGVGTSGDAQAVSSPSGSPAESGASARGPLAGLRVIDFTQAMAGPFCTMNLADMGADVIKLEPPGQGEPTRREAAIARNGVSGSFMAVNRGKRSLTVDLKSPEGVAIVRRLAQTADVLVQNYRPGVAQRLGLGYDDLRAVNLQLVYCSVSGFGSTGPYASRGGYDLIAQGMSGIISVTGEEDGPPAKAGLPVSDLAAGLFAAYGILAALEHRDRTGQGQHVDTSLFEAAMALTVWESTEFWATGQAPKPVGSAHRLAAPYQAIRAADGYFTVGANTDKLFEALCTALQRPDLTKDDRFRTRSARLRHRPALIAEIEKTTAAESRAHWLARLDEAGVPAGPIATYPEALSDPQTFARGMVVELHHPVAGAIKALGVPVKLSDTPGAVARPAPLVGQHTADLLTEIGYSAADQRALRARGVV